MEALCITSPTYFLLPYIYLYSNQTDWNQIFIDHLLCFRHNDKHLKYII